MGEERKPLAERNAHVLAQKLILGQRTQMTKAQTNSSFLYSNIYSTIVRILEYSV